jgi:hypothetical protein
MTQQCNRDLDDRCRDQNGRIRQKNGNTRVGTLRETYGDDFGQGYRADMHLRTLLDKTGEPSLSQYLRRRR